MIISVDGAGDLEVDPGTPLRLILEVAGAPAARWCGPVRLDLDHRAGLAPLRHAALLTQEPRAAPPALDRPHAVAIAGPSAGMGLAPSGPAAIGRGAPAALVIDDPALSRVHAEIDGRGRVRDLGSSNGTMRVRDGRSRRVGRRRTRLRDGDLLRIGRTLMAWRDPEREPATTGVPTPVPRASGLGLAGGIAGGVALGAATGRWWVGALLAAAPAAAVAARWATRRGRGRDRPREPDGLELLAALPLPLAIVGERSAALAAARAIAMIEDRAWADLTAEPWQRWLAGCAPQASLTLAPTTDRVPSDAATVLDLTRGTLTVGGRSRRWTPALVDPRTAEAGARRSRGAEAPPSPDARWGELDVPPAGSAFSARRLVASIGRDDTGGTVALDLDADGPHVLVAGTTGSGKSLLLETLVAALAHAHGPRELGIALIDLKGGAGLGACAALPHVCGTLTDLEPHEARRALLGIADEVRARKTALRARGLPSWHAWETAGDAPPRLLVVIDEFQELGAVDAGLLGQAATLAAQGRSLGIHLVLATQRPAGAVTPQIRANVGTVIALRVASAAESQDLLGDDAAARLPPARPGSAVLAAPDRRVTLQIARPVLGARPRARLLDGPEAPAEPLGSAAARRWSGHPSPRSLWLPPPESAPAPPPGSAGWIDLPETRRREPLTWSPGAGCAIVLGPPGPSRTAAVEALASATPGAVDLPLDPREAARTLELAAVGAARAVVIEDAEAARGALESALRAPGDLLLEDYGRRVPLILGCAPGWPPRWAARAALRIVLGGVDPAEQALWGVPAHLRAGTAVAGAAVVIRPAGASAASIRGDDAAASRRPLVAPLRCDAALPEGTQGVRGDRAVPLRLAGAVEVAGADDARRERTIAALRRHGVDPVAVAAPSLRPGVVTVVAAPTTAALRAWGITAPPGLVDPQPPPGRVLLVTAEGCEAAQLRP